MRGQVEIQSLSMSFGILDVLQDIDITIHDGEFVSVIGPSGCGKTTLLKVVGGLLRPTRGRVLLDGVPASDCRERGDFGFVFQKPVLLPWRSVIQNVRLPLELVKESAGYPIRDPVDVIKAVGLAGFENERPGNLSGGMLHRAALARVLVYNPSLLLLDEPFASLDEITRDRMNVELLEVIREFAPTTLLVTHDVSESVFLSDRVLVLSRRPAHILKEVRVPLPRPRTLDMMVGDAFTDMIQCLREQLELS